MDSLEGGDSFNFLLSVSSPPLGVRERDRERERERGMNGCCAVMLQLLRGYFVKVEMVGWDFY